MAVDNDAGAISFFTSLESNPKKGFIRSSFETKDQFDVFVEKKL